MLFPLTVLCSLISLGSSTPPSRRFEKVQNVFTSSRINPLDVNPQLFQTTDGRLFALRSPPQRAFQSRSNLYQTPDGRIIRINDEEPSSLLANEDWNEDLGVVRGINLNVGEEEEEEEDWTKDVIDENLRESTLKSANNLFTPFIVNDNVFQTAAPPNEGQRFKIVRNENNYRIPSGQGLRVIDDTTASRIRNANVEENTRLLSFQNQRPLRLRLLGNSNDNNRKRQQIIQTPSYSLSDEAATGYFAFPSAGISYRYK